MNWVLNISTHGSDLENINHDWENARRILGEYEFDGFELYPVSGYDNQQIPSDLILGLHLRSFNILSPIWNGDRQRLLEIFGDEQTIEHFYGGLGPDAVVDVLRDQLDLAVSFGCEYAVFHAGQCELEHVFQWNCPWSWQDTIDLSAEVINAALDGSTFCGELLVENLWWPGSMRLDNPREVDRLLSQVNYSNCGLVLDTGHILNKNQGIRSERQGIQYILATVENLGSLASHIRAVHLTRSLSAEYVLQTKQIKNPYAEANDFWERFVIAIEHVSNIDQHDPFDEPEIARLFNFIEPAYVVFEFTSGSMSEWRDKINCQLKAVKDIKLSAH